MIFSRHSVNARHFHLFHRLASVCPPQTLFDSLLSVCAESKLQSVKLHCLHILRELYSKYQDRIAVDSPVSVLCQSMVFKELREEALKFFELIYRAVGDDIWSLCSGMDDKESQILRQRLRRIQSFASKSFTASPKGFKKLHTPASRPRPLDQDQMISTASPQQSPQVFKVHDHESQLAAMDVSGSPVSQRLSFENLTLQKNKSSSFSAAQALSTSVPVIPTAPSLTQRFKSDSPSRTPVCLFSQKLTAARSAIGFQRQTLVEGIRDDISRGQAVEHLTKEHLNELIALLVSQFSLLKSDIHLNTSKVSKWCICIVTLFKSRTTAFQIELSSALQLLRELILCHISALKM